ncbi:phospho-acceptor domain-containing protein [Dysgonomonas alginatilytica]|uniref:histidine kinase n=1 Tax=Dysgonomonas alginatilytica TaxID=1605892 RepID=A0A2V3PTB2_9BACT|nr:HAMP domain-containing sensor histidine kinase [Dysgonomonas alginatilytica]PXV65920.1 phospho-acceptor domain-containing protein [Dysgonomonas alginatilytica]
MKLRIKIIASIILISLISVSVYQLYWLKTFYDQQYKKMDISIMDAMNSADFTEIGLRVKSVTLELMMKEGALDMIPYDTLVAYQPNLNVMIDGKDERNNNRWNDNLMMYTSIQKGIHSVIDTMEAASLIRYDSILHIELKRRDVNIPYFTEQINTKNDSLLASSIDSLQNINKSLYKPYIFPYSINDEYAYRIYLKEPRLYILKEMSTLVVISLLMIVLLIISYIYLLRIIFRQKSIDEIKSDFVNNMTHELKTPISVTYAAIDALQNFGMMDDLEKRDKYLDVSKEQLMNLNNLVEQILTMSVEERKNLKLALGDISISDLYESMRNQFLINTPKKITFEIDVTPIDLTIKADKIHFPNIINNLIENAVKYSGEKVHIVLSAKQKDNRTILSIKDNGIGIPQSSINKVFDKFYRVSTGNIHNVKGYGLGLFYVKTIVDKHGWTINVDSTERKGTCFTIKI